MGQKVGVPVVYESILPVSNLPLEAIESIWTSYTLLGESFALELQDLKAILENSAFLWEKVGLNDEQISSLFTTFDTDENSLVDALELFVTLAMISGMSTEQKIKYVFKVYDFTSTNVMNLDECTLLLRSIASGLDKIMPVGINAFSRSDVDECAKLMFKTASSEKLNVDEFQTYCRNHPILDSLIRYYSSIAPEGKGVLTTQGPVPTTVPTVIDTNENLNIVDATIPWSIAADISKPEELPVTRMDAPEDMFETEWIHGYTADMTGTVQYTNDGSVIYSAAGTAVILGKAPVEEGAEDAPVVWTQRYFMDHHPAEITAITKDSNGIMIATGDNTGVVSIWSSKNDIKVSPSLKKTIIKCNYGGIRKLSMGRDGKTLLILGSDDLNTVIVYDTITKIQSEIVLGKGHVRDMVVCGDNTYLAFACKTDRSCGTGIDFFMKETEWSGASRSPAIYGSQGIKDGAIGSSITALSYLEDEDELIAGNASGQVLLFKGRNCVQVLSTHSKEGGSSDIIQLVYNSTCKKIASSGSDGRIVVYTFTTTTLSDPDAPVIKTIEVSSSMDAMMANVQAAIVRSIDISNDGMKILMGTASGEICEMSAEFIPLPVAEGEGEAEETPVEEPVEGEEGGEVAPPKPSGTQPGDDLNGGPIVRSHYKIATGTGDAPESIITGASKCPGGFITVGRDGCVKQWSSAEGAPNAMLKQTVLDAPCLGITVAGAYIAVPMGGQRTGAVQVLTSENLQSMCIVKGMPAKVTSTAFSPEGNLLSCTCADGKIYLYELGVAEIAPEPEIAPPVEGEEPPTEGEGDEAPPAEEAPVEAGEPKPAFNPKITLEVPTLSSWAVIASDFSSDGTILKTLSEDGTLTYWSLGAETLGNVMEIDETTTEVLKAATWTNVSFPAQWDIKGYNTTNGILPFDRFGAMVASCGAKGCIILQRGPAHEAGTMPAATLLNAHIGQVGALAFLEEGARLVSTGGADGIVTVWKITIDAEEAEPEPVPGEEEPAAEEEEGAAPLVYDSCDDEDAFDGVTILQPFKQAIAPEPPKEEVVEEAPPPKAADDEGEGDEDGDAPPPPKPKAPIVEFDEAGPIPFETWSKVTGIDSTTVSNDAPSVPSNFLQLERVLGYSARTTRDSVKYTSQGKIVYPAASTIVVYDKVKDKQTHFMGHDDEVTAIGMHRMSGVVASAQRSSGDVTLCIWSPDDDCSLKQKMSLGAVYGVSALEFSLDGRFVVATCLDSKHTVMVIDWAAGIIRSKASAGPKKTLSVAISQEPDTLNGTVRLLTGGINSFALHNLTGLSFNTKTGLYGQRKTSVLCCASLPLPAEGGNEFLLGCADGNIGVITRGDRRAAFSPMFPGGVTAMTIVPIKAATAEDPAVYKIVVGGPRGAFKILDTELNPVESFPETFNLYSEKSPISGLQPLGQPKGIMSVSVDKAVRKICVGTGGGEIFELDFEKLYDVNQGKGAFVTSHCRDQVLGLDAHPVRQEVVTVGDDKTCRVWDVQSGRVICTLELPDIGRCVAFSPDGRFLIVGVGGQVVRDSRRSIRLDEEGVATSKLVVLTYTQNKLQINYETIDAKQAITCVCYSKDGSKAFAGSADNSIYAYDPLNDYSLVDTLDGHTEAIASLELSHTADRLISRGVGYETKSWDLTSNKPVEVPVDSSISIHRRKTPYWSDSIGVHSDSTELSNKVTALVVSSKLSNPLMVTGERGGAVKLFDYPSRTPAAPHYLYSGHTSGGVSSVLFTKDDKRVVSLGGDDRCLFVWKVNVKKQEPMKAKISNAMTRDALNTAISDAYKATVEANGMSIDVFPVPPEPVVEVKAEAEAESSTTATEGDETSIPVEGEASEAAPVPEAEAAPEEVEVVPEVPPSATLSVDTLIGSSAYLYGKSKFTSCPIAKYGPAAQVLTSCGGAVVSTDMLQGTQRQWSMDGGISLYGNSAISVSPSRRFALVGPIAPKGFSVTSVEGAAADKDMNIQTNVSVYNASSGVLVKTLMNVPGGISCAAFSPCGKWAACVGKKIAGYNSLFLFYSSSGQWTDATTIATTIISSTSVTKLAFLGGESSTLASPLLMTCNPIGSKGVHFWTLEGNVLVKTRRSKSIEEFDSPITSILSLPSGGSVTGLANGSIIFWSGVNISKGITSPHTGAVTSLAVAKNGCIISGSSDGIKIWDPSMPVEESIEGIVCIKEISMEELGASVSRTLSSPFGNTVFVSDIDNDDNLTRLLISLSSNHVLELALDSRKAILVSEGHAAGGVVSVATHPTDANTVVTVGADSLLKIWDLGNGETAPRVIETHVLIHAPTCVEFKSDGYELCVGVEGTDTNGNYAALLIMKYDPSVRADIASGATDGTCLTTEVKVHNVGVGKVTSIKYNKDSKTIAAVSEDKKIYLYSVEKGFQSTGYLDEHKCPISSFDFNATTRYVRTYSGMTSTDIAGGNKVAVRYFDLSVPTRAMAGTEVNLTDIPEGELKWMTNSNVISTENAGCLCLPASGDAVSEVITQGDKTVAILSSGGLAAFTTTAAGDITTTSAGKANIHSAGQTKASFLANGKVFSAGSDGTMAVWSVL